ncbi:MAG: histidine kinase, partial [Lewinella sp.]|nr:histidine kinase [Lewinella sp.]
TVVDQLRIPALCERYFLQRTYRDAAGNYWIGSRDGGLFLVPAPWQRVRHIPTPASEELSFERLVAMPGGRLLGITANTGIYEIREDAMLEILPPDRLQYFRSALWEPAGLLVASSQQLSRIRLVDDLWQVSPVHFQGVEGADPELSRTLGAFFADREEEILWNLLDLGQDAITGEVLALRGGGDFLLHLQLEGGGARLQSLQVARDIAVMLVHPDQQQWYYGSPAGLWEGAEPNPRPFLRAYPELRNITSLYGSPDRLWIGVEGAGLFVYTFSEDQLRRVDGVGQVDVIRPAAKNELLAAGREGVYVVTIDQGRVLEHYTVHDGLSTSLVNDVYAKGDSLIYIASPKGVQIIDRRRSYSSGLSAGALSLRGIRVNDTLAPADQLGRLGHRRNSLTFRYHLRSYASNGAITYFTRLEPLEEEWQSSGEREVRYAALAPGRYAFHLRARDAFGHEVSLAPIPIHIYPPFWRTGWFLGAAAMAFVGLVWGVYRWRLRREKDRLRTEQALEKRLAGLELDALKAQMNPHFVFNALGAIQYFIQTREVEAADHYLTKFARLMRQYLESSREKMIPLDQEVDLLRQYSELEQMRFEELFAVDISVAPELHRQDHYLPAMLIQPFVENAINHGLCERRDGQGRLAVTFNWDGERIRCTIADNGIGRERAGQLRHRGHRSRGMAIVRDKIETLRTSGLADIDVTVQDLDPAATDFPGTLVSLLIKNLDDETP